MATSLIPILGQGAAFDQAVNTTPSAEYLGFDLVGLFLRKAATEHSLDVDLRENQIVDVV
ncbi:hypothetical protein [Rhizobium sp. NFR12]|uniref:hypothetical protein n=1 Tax=Rhizobium sp. NFR12 TaxID=1566261 RepID=UPI001114C97D|nr:hypothetical protein [Rhizobium sp. NFR12]